MLFRPEAIRAASDRLEGTVSIATPVSWQFAGAVLLAIALLCVGVAGASSYSRVETVTGVVVLDKGVLEVVPSRPGLVISIRASEGDRVRAGEVLATIRAEEDVSRGGATSRRIQAALAKQDQSLAFEARMRAESSRADRERLAAQIRGMRDESLALATQIGDQERLVALADADFETAKAIATKGYVSKRDVESREYTVISRRQQLSQLRQALSSKQAEISAAVRTIDQSVSGAIATTASISATREALVQEMAQAELSAGYVIRAPLDGTVTTVLAREGQRVSADRSVLSIIPATSKARVELSVPSTAIGFVSTGQVVRIAIDAFPYEKFGTIEGRITAVSRAAVMEKDRARFLVQVDFQGKSPEIGDVQRPLLPGMQVTARIITERRSIIEWVLAPLYTVTRR